VNGGRGHASRAGGPRCRRQGPSRGAAGEGPRGRARGSRGAAPPGAEAAAGESGGAAPRREGARGRAKGRAAGGRRPHAGAAGGRAQGLQGARVGEKKEGARREGKGREREENGGEGSSPWGSNSGDRCLQNLGHHGERERLLHWRNQMREKGPGGTRMGSRGRQGRAG
jgi:hypothetical protein